VQVDHIVKAKSCVVRCLAHIRELLEILHKNHATIIAQEHIADETEGEKFTKVCNAYVYRIQSCLS